MTLATHAHAADRGRPPRAKERLSCPAAHHLHRSSDPSFQPLRSVAVEGGVVAGARLAVAVQVAIAEEEEEAPEKLSRPYKTGSGWVGSKNVISSANRDLSQNGLLDSRFFSFGDRD